MDEAHLVVLRWVVEDLTNGYNHPIISAVIAPKGAAWLRYAVNPVSGQLTQV